MDFCELGMKFAGAVSLCQPVCKQKQLAVRYAVSKKGVEKCARNFSGR